MHPNGGPSALETLAARTGGVRTIGGTGEESPLILQVPAEAFFHEGSQVTGH